MQGRNRKVSLLIFIYLVVPVEKCSTTFSALLDIRMTYLPTFWSKKNPTESRRIMYLFAYLNKASHVLNKNCLSGKATAKILSHPYTCAKNNCTSFEAACGSPGWIDKLIKIACGSIVCAQTAIHTQSCSFGKTRQSLKFQPSSTS